MLNNAGHNNAIISVSEPALLSVLIPAYVVSSTLYQRALHLLLIFFSFILPDCSQALNHGQKHAYFTRPSLRRFVH